jgi:hypothetical protein
MIRKREKVRLIDDAGFAVQRVKYHDPRRDGAWFRSGAHLAHIRTLRCIACGTDQNIEAAHLRKGTDGAMAQKPSDYFVTPQCARCHKVSHTVGEPAFYAQLAIDDPIRLALDFALRSTCHKTVGAATEEWRRRYG